MTHAVVCATRGGEVSRRTQERAIALARERGAELIFLCVVNPNIAGPLEEELSAALRDELQRFGCALLSIARARARKEGVEARTVVLSGPVWPSIGDYLREVNADTLVIGAPRTRVDAPETEVQEADDFFETVRQLTGVEVVIVE